MSEWEISAILKGLKRNGSSLGEIRNKEPLGLILGKKSKKEMSKYLRNMLNQRFCWGQVVIPTSKSEENSFGQLRLHRTDSPLNLNRRD